MSDDWSHWVRIEIAKSKKGPFNYLGIYQIQVVTASGDPIPICRLGGVDPFGLLYMGRSGDHFPRTVQNRVKEFAQLQHSGGEHTLEHIGSWNDFRSSPGTVWKSGHSR